MTPFVEFIDRAVAAPQYSISDDGYADSSATHECYQDTQAVLNACQVPPASPSIAELPLKYQLVVDTVTRRSCLLQRPWLDSPVSGSLLVDSAGLNAPRIRRGNHWPLLSIFHDAAPAMLSGYVRLHVGPRNISCTHSAFFLRPRQFPFAKSYALVTEWVQSLSLVLEGSARRPSH